MPVLLKKVPAVPVKGAPKTTSHDNSHPQQVSPAKPAAPSAQGQQSETHVAAGGVPTATHGSTLFKPQITATNIARPTAQKTTRPSGPQLSLSASLRISSHPPSATKSATVSHEFARPSFSGSITKHQSQTRPTSSSSSARFSDSSEANSRKSHSFTHSKTLFKSSILPGSTKLHPRPSSAANLHTSDAGVFPSPAAHKTSSTFSMSAAHTMHSAGSSQSDGHHRPSRPGSSPKSTAVHSSQISTPSRTSDKKPSPTRTEAPSTSHLSVANPASTSTRFSNTNHQPGRLSTAHSRPYTSPSSESSSQQSEPSPRLTSLNQKPTAKPPTPSSESRSQQAGPPARTSLSEKPAAKSSSSHPQTNPSVATQSPTATVASQTQGSRPSDHHPVNSSSVTTDPRVIQHQPTSTFQPESTPVAETDTANLTTPALAQTTSISVLSSQTSNTLSLTNAKILDRTTSSYPLSTSTSVYTTPAGTGLSSVGTNNTGGILSSGSPHQFSAVSATTDPSSSGGLPAATSSLASPQRNNTSPRVRDTVIGGSVAACVILIAAIVTLIFYRRKRQKRAARYRLVDDAFHVSDIPKMSYMPVPLVNSAPPDQQVFPPTETTGSIIRPSPGYIIQTDPMSQQNSAVDTAKVRGDHWDASNYGGSIYRSHSHTSSGTSSYVSAQEDLQLEGGDPNSMKPRINSVASNSTAKSNVNFGFAL